MDRVQGWRARFYKWLRSDWCGLFIISAAVVLKGFLYLPLFTTGHDIPAIEKFFPTDVAAVLWIVAGLSGMLCVVFQRFGPQMVGVGTGLHTLWGLMYIGSWMAGDSPRGHVTAVLYIGFVALILWGYGNTREVRLSPPREEHE